jgi:hypothetical protein
MLSKRNALQGVSGILAISLMGVNVGLASCFIGWNIHETLTCMVADSNRNFRVDETDDPNVITSWFSSGEGDWEITLLPQNSSIDNLEFNSPATDPTSMEVSDGGGFDGDEFVSICTGKLDLELDENPSGHGTYTLNAWKAGDPGECTGGWAFDVLPNGQSCN